MMRFRLASLALAAAIVGAVGLMPVSTASAETTASSFTDIRVEGRGANGEKLQGTLNIESFVEVDDELVAKGTLKGKLGQKIVAKTAITLEVDEVSGSCRLLHLELDPRDVKLRADGEAAVGVDLEKIVLDVEAKAKLGLIGDLLSDTLCDVANLADELTGGALDDLVEELNDLLRELR